MVVWILYCVLQHLLCSHIEIVFASKDICFIETLVKNGRWNNFIGGTDYHIDQSQVMFHSIPQPEIVHKHSFVPECCSLLIVFN